MAVKRALQSIHEKGWHHHDIHPGNVLRDEDNHYWIIDFGHAQRAIECLEETYCPDIPYLTYSDD